jgi:hypothetical protein
MVPLGAASLAGLGGALAARFGGRVLQTGLTVVAAGVAGLVLTIRHFGGGLTGWQFISMGGPAGLGWERLAGRMDYVAAWNQSAHPPVLARWASEDELPGGGVSSVR